MNTAQIVLSGVGGQGIISCGYILGSAAVEFSGKYATMTSSYGSEARGTFTKTDIIISDGPISYIEVEEPQIVLSLAQIGYERYYNSIEKGTIMVYDSSFIKPSAECIAKQYGFPFKRIAMEIGYAGSANLVSIGFIVKLTGILNANAVKDAIISRYSSNEKIQNINIKALQRGLQLEF